MKQEESSEYVKQYRHTEYDIHPLILDRWSMRAMSGGEIEEKELFSIFEAARWAPSSSNSQPWRFHFARRESKEWKMFFELLVDFNKLWCKHASVLVIIASKKTFDRDGKFSRTHSFDTGAAWMNMALEGTRRGFVVHGIAGFDYDKAAELLGLGDEYSIEAMVAIGKKGKKESLPIQLQEREVPSTRKRLGEIVFEGVKR